MILIKIICSLGSSWIKTRDLNKNFKSHKLIKSYKQQMISRKIIYSRESLRIKAKDLNKIFK